MLRPPPISTLFPYTTLFRSRDTRLQASDHPEEVVAVRVEVVSGRERHRHEHLQVEAEEHELRRQNAGDDVGLRIHDDADRKSTRLNSSHLGISYAVFCLKKK